MSKRALEQIWITREDNIIELQAQGFKHNL